MFGFSQRLCYNLAFKKRRDIFTGAPLVKPLQEVTPQDEIAEGYLVDDFINVSLPADVELSTSQFLSSLTVKEGDYVERGQVLFSRKGLLGYGSAQLTCPKDGVVIKIDHYQFLITIKTQRATKPIKSFYGGKVTSVERNSVTIEGQGHFLQGVYGVGAERISELANIGRYNEILDSLNFPVFKNKILCGLESCSLNFLLEAVKNEIAGLILGWLDYEILSKFCSSDVFFKAPEGFCLVLLEKFSQANLQERFKKFFEVCDGTLASVCPKTQIRSGSLRPEIWAWGKTFEHQATKRYRVISDEHWGQETDELEFLKDQLMLESGVVTSCAKVGAKQVVVPLANLEEIFI